MLQEMIWALSNIQRPLRHVSAVLLQVTEAATWGVLLNKVKGLFRTPPDDYFQSQYSIWNLVLKKLVLKKLALF